MQPRLRARIDFVISCCLSSSSSAGWACPSGSTLPCPLWPGLSLAFQPLLSVLPEDASWTFDRCCFGEPWLKRTRVLTNLDLAGRTELCLGGHSHIQLRGRSKLCGSSRPKASESFPRGVNEAIAASLSPALLKQHASVSSVVFCQCIRIGEASTPGPARKHVGRDSSLFDLELVEPITLQVRESIWEVFVKWLRAACPRRLS